VLSFDVWLFWDRICIIYVEKKPAELDAELKKIKLQRDDENKILWSKLQSNHSEQEQLRQRLRQLVEEDEDLSAKIKQNDRHQAEADQVFNSTLLSILSI